MRKHFAGFRFRELFGQKDSRPRVARRRPRLFLEPLEQRLTPDAAPGIQPGSLLSVYPNSTPFGNAQPNDASAQITGIYQLLLNRAPEADALNFWTNLVNGGGSNLGQVATFVLNSPEYSKNLVTDDYQYLLGRTPEAAGLAFWTNYVQSHADARSLALQMVASPEYQAGFGTANDLVESLYTKVLGRASDPSGAAFWVQQMASGASPMAVATDFAYSQEALATGVQGFYQTFLQTTASSGQLSGSLQEAQNQPVQVVLANLVNSSPYQTAATAGTGGASFSNDFAFDSNTLAGDPTDGVPAATATPYGQALYFPPVPYDATQTGNAAQPTLQLPGTGLLSQAALQGGLTFQIQFKASNPGALLTEQLAVSGGGGNSNYLAPLVYLNGSGRLVAGVFDQTRLTIQLSQNLLSWPDANKQIQVGAANPIVSMGTLVDNTWHEMALVATSTSESLYVDGVLQGTKTGAFSMSPVIANFSATSTPGKAYIGGTIFPEPAVASYPKLNYPQGYEGSVDEVGLWIDTVHTHGESAFTQAQVQQTLSGPLTTTNPVTATNRWIAYLNFDQPVAGTTNQWPNLATGSTAGPATGPTTGSTLTTTTSTIAFDPFPNTVPRLPGYLNMGIDPMTPLAVSSVNLVANTATKFKVSLEAGDQLEIRLPQVPPGSLSVSIQDNLGNTLPSFQIGSGAQQVIAAVQNSVFQLTLTWTPNQADKPGTINFENIPGPNNSIMELLTSFKQTGAQSQNTTIYAYGDPTMPTINPTLSTANPNAAANYFPLWTDTRYFPTSAGYTTADLGTAYKRLSENSQLMFGLPDFANIINTGVSDPTVIQSDLNAAYQNVYKVAPPQPPNGGAFPNTSAFPVLPAASAQDAVYEFFYNTNLLRAKVYPVLTGSGSSANPSSLPSWIQGAINEILSAQTAHAVANAIALGQAQQVPSSITIKLPPVQRHTDWIAVVAGVASAIGGIPGLNATAGLGLKVLSGALLAGDALANTFAAQAEGENLTVDVSAITNNIVNALNLQQMAGTIDTSESDQWNNFRNALLDPKFAQSVLSNFGLLQAFDVISAAPLGEPAMSPKTAIDNQVSYIAWQNMVPAVFHWVALPPGDKDGIEPDMVFGGTAGSAIAPNNVTSALPNYLNNLATLQSGGRVLQQGVDVTSDNPFVQFYQYAGTAGIPFLSVTQTTLSATNTGSGFRAFNGASIQSWGLVDNSGKSIAAATENQLFGNPAASAQSLTPANSLDPIVGYNGGWYYAALPFQNAPTTWAQAFFAWGDGTVGYSPQNLVATVGDPQFNLTVSQSVVDAPPAILPGTQVDLTQAYNRIGITSVLKPYSGGFNAQGRSLPAEYLGTGLDYNVHYTFGRPDQNNVIDIQGQTIPLPAGNFSSLYMLADAVNGDQLNKLFTITYTDGTTQAFTQSFSDWGGKNPQPGQFKAILVNTSYTASGTFDDFSRNQTISVFGDDFAGLDPTKTVKSITLPSGGSVEILAMTLLGPGSRLGALPDGSTFPVARSLDGSGLVISSKNLGASVAYNTSTFGVDASRPYNAISAAGQIVPVLGSKSGATVLNILALGVNGNQPNQAITLSYTDAVPQTITQSFSGWTTPQNYFGEATAVRMPYADKSDGTQVAGQYYVYGYTIQLSGNLESITLPNNPNLEIFGLQVAAAPVTTRAGIIQDGSSFSPKGGLDGSGNALLASQLGASVIFNNTTFTFGPTNANDMYTAAGQTLALTPGIYARLNLLAVATFGQSLNQTFKVNYTDGTSDTFTQSLSDWVTNGLTPLPGEIVAKRMDAYAQNNGQPHVQPGSIYVYGYSFQLNVNKTVQSITLPNNPKVDILGFKLSMNGITDSSFEGPLLGQSFRYNPTGSPWSFTSTSGLSGNGTGFTNGNPNAPDGSQVAFLQSSPQKSGTVTQVVMLPAGNYTLSFYAAQRNFPGNDQEIYVAIDAAAVFHSVAYTPTSTAYTLETTTPFHVSAGAHTVEIAGVDQRRDNTAFIDDVFLTAV